MAESKGLRKPRPEILDPLPSDPSPEQIAEACLAFQATWTTAERAQRLGRRKDDPKDEIIYRCPVPKL
jgi:hypothetical protein